MRTALLIAAVGAALAVPTAAAVAQMHAEDAAATGPTVQTGFSQFEPPDIDVLVGDTVHWANDSARFHTVTADDGSFDSGRLTTGTTFSHRYDQDGTFGYHCTIHAGMVGVVTAYTLLVAAPGAPAGPGKSFPLSGRAALPAGSSVSIEGDAGAGFAPAGTASVGQDGTFVTTVTPVTTTSYRALAGGAVSPAIRIVVLDHTVSVAVSRHRTRTVIRTHVTPPAPGQDVVLQLRLRDRFGFFPVRHARLDTSSRARFTVPLRHRVPARILLTLPDQGTSLADSPTVTVGPPA